MEIFDYDNILLLPRKCRVDSRSECDASVELGPRRFRIPVVPANMKMSGSSSFHSEPAWKIVCIDGTK